MAWLEEHPTSGHFKICFRWGGRKLKKTVKTTDRGDAETALLNDGENIARLPGRNRVRFDNRECTFHVLVCSVLNGARGGQFVSLRVFYFLAGSE